MTERSTEGKTRSARSGYNGGQREWLCEISKMLREQKKIWGGFNRASLDRLGVHLGVCPESKNQEPCKDVACKPLFD